jgi:2-oxoglutarate dehydrogenase E2 component (dihydrolipoamide succinyltransferase)
VTTATIAKWLKNPGDSVAADEPVVELETDKVNVEVAAPEAGVLGPQSSPKAPRSRSGPSWRRSRPAAAPQGCRPPARAGVQAQPVAASPVARPATPPSDVAAQGAAHARCRRRRR